jgi:hypothetical protein
MLKKVSLLLQKRTKSGLILRFQLKLNFNHSELNFNHLSKILTFKVKFQLK